MRLGVDENWTSQAGDSGVLFRLWVILWPEEGSNWKGVGSAEAFIEPGGGGQEVLPPRPTFMGKRVPRHIVMRAQEAPGREEGAQTLTPVR